MQKGHNGGEGHSLAGIVFYLSGFNDVLTLMLGLLCWYHNEEMNNNSTRNLTPLVLEKQ